MIECEKINKIYLRLENVLGELDRKEMLPFTGIIRINPIHVLYREAPLYDMFLFSMGCFVS